MEVFGKISERCGPVFTVHLGPWRVVVLGGYDTVTEALVDQAEEFSGRGKQANFSWLFKGYAGSAPSSWERAEHLRRFSTTALRDFGVGERAVEERIQGEADLLIEACRGTRGAFLDPTFFLSRTVSSVISSVVFGGRFDYEDKEFLSLLRMMLGSFQFTATSTGQLCEMFYSVKKHLPGPQQQAFKELQGLEDFIAKKVEQDQCTLDPNSPWNLIDPFFIRVQEVHASSHQGAKVFPMLGSMLRDPKFFSNLRDFNPQHFLDEKGQFKKSDASVPFSIGKWCCFGEGLARTELFLFLTTIMQNFRFKSPQSPQDIDVYPKHVGFVTIPQSYTMSFLPL
eukprot:XP_028334059.1 cytochrome P450 2A13-like [Physeter catodon]